MRRLVTKCCHEVPNGLNCCPECGRRAHEVGTMWVREGDDRAPGKYERIGRKAGACLDGVARAVRLVVGLVRRV